MRDQESTGEHPGSSPDAVPSLMGALAGTAGAAVGLGFGELVEGASESIPSLVVAVSELLSDYTPGDVVRFSIANFGASQKTLLTAGIIVGSLVLGGVLGRFAARGRPRAMLAGFALFGLLGGWAAARNPISPAAGSWVVGLAAAALAAGTTLLLVGRLAKRAVRSPATLPVDQGQPEPAAEVAAPGEVQTRRAFFAYAVGAGAAALAMVGLGRALRGQSAAEQFLETNTLRSAATTTAPRPSTTDAAAAPASTTSTTAPAPAGPSIQEQVAALDTLDDDVAGISSYVTPNDSFYRIDT
ncbi:MAG: hypothetical protein F4016_11425, partial [Acidimicrobiaceae bacterium]|nr:hypothetical protein [Acidimicrobiaceae bacterium]